MGEKDRKAHREEIKKTVFRVFDQFESSKVSGELLIEKISYLVKKI